MVGTAQADSFAIFIRKVGYSVGLESLLGRAADFGESYGRNAGFREADWERLVREKWKLKSGNVADVFHAFDIAHIRNHEVFAGSIGEALGICARLLMPEEYEIACRYLIALAVVSADGDVFLNALKGKFKKDDVSAALVSMVQQKREVLFEEFSTKSDREHLAISIAIDRQRTNRGGGSSGGLAAAARGVPLGEKAGDLGLPRPVNIHYVDKPSEDYLRKISISRKGWAESLGLFQKEDLTTKGVIFLSSLARSGFVSRDGTYCVWPTDFDAKRHRFDPERFKLLELPSAWRLQRAVFEALDGVVRDEKPTDSELGDAATCIATVYGAYRELAQHRAMIRNEVPGAVVVSVALARALAQGRSSIDWGLVWDSPILSNAGIVIRRSGTIENAIAVKRYAHQASQ